MHRCRQDRIEPAIDAIEILVFFAAARIGLQDPLDARIDPMADGAKGEQRRRHGRPRLGEALERPAEGIAERLGQHGIAHAATAQTPATDRRRQPRDQIARRESDGIDQARRISAFVVSRVRPSRAPRAGIPDRRPLAGEIGQRQQPAGAGAGPAPNRSPRRFSTSRAGCPHSMSAAEEPARADMAARPHIGRRRQIDDRAQDHGRARTMQASPAPACRCRRHRRNCLAADGDRR